MLCCDVILRFARPLLPPLANGDATLLAVLLWVYPVLTVGREEEGGAACAAA